MTEKRVSPLRLNRAYIAVLLASYGVSQKEIAQLAKVHKVTVSKVLRNYRRVSPEKRLAVLRALANRFGRAPEELVVQRLAA